MTSGAGDVAREILGALVVVVALVAGACHEAARAPTRPFGVPSYASWAGGSDGGSWIDCRRASDEQHALDGAAHPELDATFHCSIYDEAGRITKRSAFELKDVDDAGRAHRATDPRRVMRYAGWDGVRVLLDDGRVLE